MSPTSNRLLTLALVALAACGQGTPPDRFKNPEFSRTDAVTSVCAGANTVPGIDVSSWQGSINWGSVAGAGYKFAIARINDGTFNDPDFGANWAGIKNAGMIRGAYQFFEPGDDATWQANVVVNAVGQLGAGDLPVTLDVETATPTFDEIATWANIVQQGTGKTPMIYTAWGEWNGWIPGGGFEGNPLWVANYGVQCPGMPNHWTSWVFWQFGGNTVPGISGNVDQDLFNGTEDDLNNFAGAVNANGCSTSQVSACGNFGCSCADNQCNGGYCPGTGCNATLTGNCAAFGCQCVDGQCNGGYCPGGGCTAKEQNDCAQYGCQCVDHACNGGFCAGSGCTAKEITDCGNYGVNCVDHQCSGGYGPGSGCTAKEQIDCQNQGCGCVDHACSGGSCQGTGCTARETLDCSDGGGSCSMGSCLAPTSGTTTGAASTTTGTTTATATATGGTTATATTTGTSTTATATSTGTSTTASATSTSGTTGTATAGSTSGGTHTTGTSGAASTSAGSSATTGEPASTSTSTGTTGAASTTSTGGGSTTLSVATSGSTSGSSTTGAPPKGGCGCNSGDASSGIGVLGIALAVLARRRRT
ncbi:MAG: hypothetical protein JST54_23590 [Deltaproteobacteria bacterium]|nr:hypothetical protein [Deltaproteobacteria bacterium]